MNHIMAALFTLIIILCTMTTLDLNIASFNTNGSGPGKLEYASRTAKDLDFLFIQEHWLHSEQISSIQKTFPDMCIHGVSGMDESELLQGRPYGGLAILWKQSLTAQVCPVTTSSRRLCAVSVKNDDFHVLLCNVYMPCDTEFDRDNLYQYECVLEEISQLAVATNTDVLIIGGDLNTDLVRSRSLHTKALNDFLDKECLKPVIRHSSNKVDYTYESKVSGERSTLDHFLISENLFDLVAHYTVKHDGDNLSDHSPVCLRLTIPVYYTDESDEPSGCRLPYFKWTEASDEDKVKYAENLDRLLDHIRIPREALVCDDPHCTEHTELLRDFHDSVTEACVKAAASSIPVSHGQSKNCVPGWNSHVEGLREQAIFWHNLWKSNNSPREGIIADLRRSTRAKYHRAVKWTKKNKDKIVATKMASSLLDKKSGRSFWAEVRKQRGGKDTLPSSIDGQQGAEQIAALFSSKYESLYNSVSYQKHEMAEILSELNEGIDRQCSAGRCTYSHSITLEDVSKAVLHMNPGKSDGSTGMTTDHVIQGSKKLQLYIAMLLDGMFHHGYAPDGFLLSTIISIPKNRRKSMNDSSNYRGIALSSVSGKIMDWIFLERYKDVFNTSDLQFGFKRGHSTTQCTFVVKETVNYYLNSGSNVYSMLLDASKAFDRVGYVKMFRLLLQKGLCHYAARFLAFVYTHQTARVQWGRVTSPPFQVSNGVSVLSPILFGLYIDQLLLRLRNAGVGCYIGHVF